MVRFSSEYSARRWEKRMRIAVIFAMVLIVSCNGLGSEERLLAKRAEIDRELAAFREWKRSTIGPGVLSEEKGSRAHLLRKLGESNPGLHAKVRYLLDSRRKLSSPVYLTPHHAVIIQPDGKKTDCDLWEGHFYRYDSTSYHQSFRKTPEIDAWETVGEIIIGWSDDEVVDALPRGPSLWVWDDVVVVGEDFYPVVRSGEFEYLYMKKSGSLKPLGEDIYLLAYGGMGDGYYALYRDKEDEHSRFDRFGHRIRPVSRLTCYSPEDTSVKWQKKAKKGEKWLGMVLEDDRITVFGDKSAGRRGPTFAQVFTADGEEVERFPTSAEMFGGDGDPAFRGSYEFRGVRYHNAGRPSRPDSREINLRIWRRIEEKFGHVGEVAAVVELPGDGFAWIGIQDDEKGGKNFFLHYRGSDGRAWRGRLGTVEDIAAGARFGLNVDLASGTFSLAGNDNFLVYATAGGRMECVNRADGASRWIYLFPTVMFPARGAGSAPIEHIRLWFGPESLFSFGPFFVNKAAAREFEMSGEGVSPLAVEGMPAVAPRIVTDEKRDDTYKKMSRLGAAFSLYGPLAVLTLLWAFVFLQLGNRVHFWLVVCGAALVDVFLLRYFGAYVWYATVLMYVVLAAVVLCAVFGESLRKRYRLKKEGRKALSS